MNSKKQGDIGVGKAIAWFVAKGYTVSIPLTDSQDYDLIVDLAGTLSKVQVKTGTSVNKAGVGMLNLSVKGGNRSGSGSIKFTSDQVWDYLFGYHLVTEQVIFIPKSEIKAETGINLGEKYASWIS